MKQRQMLKLGGGMGAGLLGGFGGSEIVQAAEKLAPASRGGKGIAEIRMQSARLEKVRTFYQEKPGLPVTATIHGEKAESFRMEDLGCQVSMKA